MIYYIELKISYCSIGYILKGEEYFKDAIIFVLIPNVEKQEKEHLSEVGLNWFCENRKK